MVSIGIDSDNILWRWVYYPGTGRPSLDDTRIGSPPWIYVTSSILLALFFVEVIVWLSCRPLLK